MQLVETHIISKNHKFFNEIDRLCFKSKNLYNAGLYEIRQCFFKTGEYLNYNTLQRKFQNEKNPDYYALPAKISQQVLMQLDLVFKSFFNASKEYKINPNKFSAKPRIPRYKHKEQGRNKLTYTIQAISKKFLELQSIKLSGTEINFPTKASNINQVRIIACNYYYKIEVVYTMPEQKLKNTNIIAGIDIGLNNLATVAINSKNSKPFIINGKPLKSINQFL